MRLLGSTKIRVTPTRCMPRSQLRQGSSREGVWLEAGHTEVTVVMDRVDDKQKGSCINSGER